MAFSREKMIGGVLVLVCLVAILYGGWLQFGPSAKYRGLTTRLDVQIDDATRAYLENQIKTDQASVNAAKLAGKEVDLNLYASISSNAYSLGWLAVSKEALDAELKANPINYGAWNNLGSVLEAMGDFKNARASYEKALDVSAGKGPEKFYIDEVNILEAHFAGEQDKIKAVLELALSTKGQTSWNMVMLGRWYNVHGDCQSAIEHFKVAQSLSPKNTSIGEELQTIEGTCK
ncbi:MAG: tetratricopeptide repeat protein [Patescibacteria group bacterium]